MAQPLADHVAFITGAARGQGRAEAVRLAEAGADIIALDVCGPIKGRERFPASTPDDLAETVKLVEETGRRIVAVQGDVRAPADLDRAVAAGMAQFGRLDIVIANAGVAGGGVLSHEISEEDWATTIDINFTGVWRTVKTAIPHIIAGGRGGSIILTASSVGIGPKMHLADYGSAKAGLIMMAKVFALEYGAHNVRANAIAPGNVDTPLLANEVVYKLFRPDLEHPTRADVEPAFASTVPLKQQPLLDPDDIAHTAVWLCSPQAARLTGTVISVDMGSTI